MNPEIIQSAGDQLGINVFEENPDIWSKININFAISEIFQWLIHPGGYQRKQDPVVSLLRLFTGTNQQDSFIMVPQNLEGSTSPFWKRGNYGTLTLDYLTFIQFFGANLYEIQPALYYSRSNIATHGQQLSVDTLLTSELINKIEHLFNNLYDILSNNYKNGQKLTAEFHIENHLGFNDESNINEALNQDISDKFNDLIIGNILEFTFNKDHSGEILNNDEFRTFITSIVFYMVMFNTQVFIREGDIDVDVKYGLFASQRELFSSDYIIGLGEGNPYARLSVIGNQIFHEWNSKWNIEDNKVVWNYGDCWPIYLFDDARTLINWFSHHFLNDRNSIKDLSNINP